jgi:glycosyltransferase involved in cell wall biosynthesis
VSMKKRIAIWIHGGVGTGHFSQGYPPLEKLIVRLSDLFELVVYSQSPTDKNYKPSLFELRSVPAGVRWGVLRWLYLFFLFFKDHRRKKFQLIFAFWGYPAGFLATCISRMVTIPSVVYILGSDSAGIPSINFGIFHKPIPRKLALWTYNTATQLLAISEFQRKQLQTYGVTKSIVTIPWGVETGLYKFIPKDRGNILRVIHVGHLTPVKDQATLLRALALIAKQHSVELRIFGVDCMNGSIQKLCNELGLEKNVRFFDMIPYDQMPAQYEWADIMLHTSVSEGQSMAITEAAACGVLLAGTKVGLLHDLGENCGITVEVGDFEGLAAKVLRILADRQRWDQKLHQAKLWSESHDLAWTVREISSRLNTIGSADHTRSHSS